MDYEGLGHLVAPPFDPVITEAQHPVFAFAKGTMVQMGGDKEPHLHVSAQAQMWREIQKFISSVYTSPDTK